MPVTSGWSIPRILLGSRAGRGAGGGGAGAALEGAVQKSQGVQEGRAQHRAYMAAGLEDWQVSPLGWWVVMGLTIMLFSVGG